MYVNQNFDLAGFCLGIVERKDLLPKKNITPGDLILGLKSSGIHANGFSLVREIIKKENINLSKKAEFNNDLTIGEAILTPTKIYTKIVLTLLKEYEIKGVVHITGGGIIHNLPRVLPKSCGADIYSNNIPVNSKNNIFNWIQKITKIEMVEMLETFNCGIGILLIINEKDYERIVKTCNNLNEGIINVGKINGSGDINII